MPASLVSILISVAIISCYLPLGFAAPLGASPASAFFTTLRPRLSGFFRCFASPRILAAASLQAVLDRRPSDRECAAHSDDADRKVFDTETDVPRLVLLLSPI
jgi:hypothetical protein